MTVVQLGGLLISLELLAGLGVFAFFFVWYASPAESWRLTKYYYATLRSMLGGGSVMPCGYESPDPIADRHIERFAYGLTVLCTLSIVVFVVIANWPREGHLDQMKERYAILWQLLKVVVVVVGVAAIFRWLRRG